MEEWRDIPGYVGLYQASSEGRIRSLVRVLDRCTAEGVRREKKVLSPGGDHNGRLHVALSSKGTVRHFQVHRLVLEAFVGPCPPGMECLHGDGDHANCALENLRWGTRVQNRDDQRRHGRAFGAPKKLTKEEAAAIRADPDTQRKIADKYGVSQVTVHMIKTGRTWNDM